MKVEPLSNRVAGSRLMIYYVGYAAMGKLAILCPVLQLFRLHAMFLRDSINVLFG